MGLGIGLTTPKISLENHPKAIINLPHCSGLKEPPGIHILNALSPDGGTVFEGLGGMVFLQQEWVVEKFCQNTNTSSVFLSLCLLPENQNIKLSVAATVACLIDPLMVVMEQL